MKKRYPAVGMPPPFRYPILFIAVSMAGSGFSEPVVLSGSAFPSLTGAPIRELRVVTSKGVAIPFQIDERTAGGDYIGSGGPESNADSAHAALQDHDEIVFLREDADSESSSAGATGLVGPRRTAEVAIAHGAGSRRVFLVDDSTIPLSPVRYIFYDERTQDIRTPWYDARFARDRFHFVRAGIMDSGSDRWVDIVKQLRIGIVLKTLWGIFPIRYNEDNIVCLVNRYTIGPIRLIRRGNFYLRLGFLGLKGSRAVVYQKCYPQEVEVPVHVHLPIRLSALFSAAYFEMTPVISGGVQGFNFSVPSIGTSFECASPGRIDTLIRITPDRGYMVSDGATGFAWITRVGVDDARLAGSGYLFRRPSNRGVAECGVRYAIRDLPKGNYTIDNWVLFPHPLVVPRAGDCMSFLQPATVSVSGKNAADLFVTPFAGEP
jgi:hypothetical protein